MGDFSKAVRAAIGTGVPCARPFTGIELLQLINHRDVEGTGVFSRKHVLTSPGNNAETLITYVDDEDEKKKLTSLVATAGVHKILALDVKYLASLEAGVHASIPLEDLATVGLKATSDTSWSLSFANGQIQKKSVDTRGLRNFLKVNQVHWDDDFKNKKAIVTGIYYVSGGFKFTGDAKFVTTGGVLANLPPSVPVDLTAGWKYTVINGGTIVMSEIDPDEWIIAIEYHNVGPGKDEEVTLKKQLVTASMPQQPSLDEVARKTWN